MFQQLIGFLNRSRRNEVFWIFFSGENSDDSSRNLGIHLSLYNIYIYKNIIHTYIYMIPVPGYIYICLNACVHPALIFHPRRHWRVMCWWRHCQHTFRWSNHSLPPKAEKIVGEDQHRKKPPYPSLPSAHSSKSAGWAQLLQNSSCYAGKSGTRNCNIDEQLRTACLDFSESSWNTFSAANSWM